MIGPGSARTGPDRKGQALRRQKSQAKIFSQKRAHRKVSHADKLAFISRYVRVPDPYNRRAVTRQYKRLKGFPLYLQKPASKSERAELKKRGFFTTHKGVIVDGPRDSHRKPVKARKFKTLANGTGVKWTVNGRRDYIIGLTPQERIDFAWNPKEFLRQHRKMMREKYPDFRNARDVQTRLQWGAYQGTKDFLPSDFFAGGDTLKKEQKLMAQGKSDKLTGLHYVIHLSKSKRKKHRARKKK